MRIKPMRHFQIRPPRSRGTGVVEEEEEEEGLSGSFFTSRNG
jgi:hypothetical protein